jgi:hypothetical protein
MRHLLARCVAQQRAMSGSGRTCSQHARKTTRPMACSVDLQHPAEWLRMHKGACMRCDTSIKDAQIEPSQGIHGSGTLMIINMYYLKKSATRHTQDPCSFRGESIAGPSNVPKASPRASSLHECAFNDSCQVC